MRSAAKWSRTQPSRSDLAEDAVFLVAVDGLCRITEQREAGLGLSQQGHHELSP